MGGFGIGAFLITPYLITPYLITPDLITPWVAMNHASVARSYRLTLLDGVNSGVGCTIMGIVLTLI